MGSLKGGLLLTLCLSEVGVIVGKPSVIKWPEARGRSDPNAEDEWNVRMPRYSPKNSEKCYRCSPNLIRAGKEIFCCLTLDLAELPSGLGGWWCWRWGGGGCEWVVAFVVIFLSTDCITVEMDANSWINYKPTRPAWLWSRTRGRSQGDAFYFGMNINQI